MRRYLSLLTILVLAVLLAAIVLWQPTGVNGVTSLATKPQGGDFTLHSAQGSVNMKDFRGKVVVLFFGYTWCPDICPTNLGITSLALHELTDEEREQVQVLFISVDPERDSFDRLQQYGAFFHEKILGITGSKAEVDEVAQMYGAGYRKVERPDEKDYLIDHTADSYVVDRNGRLAEILAYGTSAEAILTALRRNLSKQ